MTARLIQSWNSRLHSSVSLFPSVTEDTSHARRVECRLCNMMISMTGYILLRNIQRETDRYTESGNKTSAARHVFCRIIQSQNFIAVTVGDIAKNMVTDDEFDVSKCIEKIMSFGFEEFRQHVSSNGSDMCCLNRAKVLKGGKAAFLMKAYKLFNRRRKTDRQDKCRLIRQWLTHQRRADKVCKRHVVAVMLSSLMRSSNRYTSMLEQFELHTRSFTKQHYIQRDSL